MSNSELRGGSPRLCRLRTDRLAPRNKIDYVLAHMRFMGSLKLSSFDGHWARWALTSLAVMYTEIVYMPPMDSPGCGITWKTCNRERWDLADSLIVVMNCGHSWCMCGSLCRVVRLLPCKVILIWISVTPSDMGDDCSLLSFYRSANSPMFIWSLCLCLIMTIW
jgi:hypothetical protein